MGDDITKQRDLDYIRKVVEWEEPGSKLGVPLWFLNQLLSGVTAFASIDDKL